MTGNVVTDVIEADSLDEAWDKAMKLDYRHVESVERTEWNGLTNCYGISGSPKSPSINNYNPD